MNHRIQKLLLGGLCLLSTAFGHAQSYGKVVINEYMPWPSASCGTTSEFVELLNFGPGPTNIGCYILTNGQYSITIPPNTILQPGQFYVIAGQSSLPRNCGNIDSAVVVHLNWNACGCTNMAIPTTGDGFMTDGGTANVNMVLFDPNLQVVDAVTRQTPVPVVSAITTSSVSSACTRKTFILSSMTVDYEQLGMSTGKSNSFARKLDGDCEWLKQPQISANATNNKGTNTSSVTYQFNITNSMDMCTNVRGAVNVSASGSNLASFFPLNYTLAYDANADGGFGMSDSYTYGSDATTPDTTISGLPGGQYIVTVGSSKGCNLKSFPFTILACQTLLPIKLIDFSLGAGNAQEQEFTWQFSDIDGLRSVVLESSIDGVRFEAERRFELRPGSPVQYRVRLPRGVASHFRLRIIGVNGRPEYSRILRTANGATVGVFPNPSADRVTLRLQADADATVRFSIAGIDGRAEMKGYFRARAGANEWPVDIQRLKPGVYQLTVDDGRSLTRTKLLRR